MKKKIVIWAVIVLCLTLIIVIGCARKRPPVASPTAPSPPTQTFTPSGPTPTFTATIPDNTLYGFETPTLGTMGWTGSGGITGTANSTYIAYYGTHSLAVECNFTSSATSGSLVVQPPLVTNFTGKMVVARMYVPSGFPSGGGAIYIQTGTGYVWQQGNWLNYTPGKWNVLYYSITETATGGDLTNVKKLGIQMSSGVFAGNLYLDAVELDTAPVTTASNTPIPSNTPGPTTPTNTPTQTATMAIPNSPDDPRIQYFGRWDKSDPTNYRADWGNVYIMANFTGTSVGINMWDPSAQNNYQYSIDGGPFVQMLASTSTAYALASGLSNTAHTLTFMRRTDCQAAVGSDIDASTNFWGFTAVNGGTFTLNAPSPRPSRKIEFIGDSISVGTDDECTVCGTSVVNTNLDENGYTAFGPQTALQLNAEWSNIGRGGIGVYHNWNESWPPNQLHMPDYYKQTLYHFAYPQWDFNTWQPDAVVIALGANDTNGQWIMPAGSTITAAYEAAYTTFINYARTVYPNATIFCMEPIPGWCMQYDGYDYTGKTYIQTMVDSYPTTSNVHYLQVNTSGVPLLSTSDYADGSTHPNDGGHTKVVNQIVPQIKSVMGW